MMRLKKLPGPAVLALLCACQGTPTIPQRQRLEAGQDVQLPPPIEIPPPSEVVEVEYVEAVTPRVGGEELYPFELRATPLANAIHLIAEKAGVNIYLDAALDRTVDASFPAVTLDDALSVLLSQNGLRLVEEPEGVFWVRTADGTQQELGSFRVHSIDAASIETDLGALVSGSSRIVVNEEQNFVMVDGSARDVEVVAEYLRGVDRMKRQVLLEVEIVELMLDEDFQLGLSHTLNNVDIDGGPNAFTLLQSLGTGNGEFSLTLDNPNVPLQSTLTALSRYVGVNVVSSPRVLAVTKSPAKVEVVTEIPYIQATVNTNVGGGSAGTSSSQQVAFKEAGVIMDVTPTIQEGGVVEVQVEQEFSNVIDFFQSIPVLDTRKVSTVMLVQDQHTVVIGGLQQNSILEDDTGVPLLMDLPLVGRFFRSDSDASQKRQLLIFITPHILDSGQAAALANQLGNEYSENLRTTGFRDAEEL